MTDEPNTPDVNQLVGESDQEQVSSPSRVIPLWVALAGMAVTLVLAVLILSRVLGPLFGLLFPAGVPVPDDVQKVEHIKPEKGSEYWIYRTSMTGRDVAEFYEDEGGTCFYTGQDPQGETRPKGVSYSVARCKGKSDSGGLSTSWEVYIAEGYSEEEGPTIFRIYKYGEVN